MIANPNRGPGDFDTRAELEGEEGPIWGDYAEIETALIESDFFKESCAESMRDYLLGPRDAYADAKFMREMRDLADKCHAHIDELEGAE